jgi:hypothetical protein
MGRVRFSADFFKKERNQLYSAWRTSFWRELFQNSIDQHATEVRILLLQGNNCVGVRFADDGPGMTRQVLEDVYFAIGATTKTANEIGGMGRARVLTCFSMKSYQLRSQDYLVIGQSGEYEVNDAPYVRGCALRIEVDDSTLEDLQAALMTFLSESRIAARIYLNDTLITRRAPLNGRAIRDLVRDGVSFAKVYVNKSAEPKVIVRVNGVAMYTVHTSAKAQVVVELDPTTSRQVLTANRDGMHWKYSNVLEEFVRELAVNTNSSLRPRFTSHTTVTRGGGMKTIRPKAVKPLRTEVVAPAPDRSMPTGAMLPVNVDDTYVEHTMPHTDFFGWLAQTFGDIYVYDETDNATMHAAVVNYVPDNWRIMTVDRGRRTYRRGSNLVRVLLMWQTAIAYALEVAMAQLKKTELAYGVGFVFADDRLAEHRTEDNGHVFSLCPVNADGKLIYKVTGRKALKRLMSLAKHEVTHVGERYHDEDFARLREEIDMEFDEAECLRRMKTALRNMPDLVNETFALRRAA